MKKEKCFQLEEALDNKPAFITELMRNPQTSAWKIFSLKDSEILGCLTETKFDMGSWAILHMDHGSN